MTYQPQSAGSAEADLIESMLQRQTQVLSELDDLFDRIDAVIEDISQQRKQQAEENLMDEVQSTILPFGPQSAEHESAATTDRAA